METSVKIEDKDLIELIERVIGYIKTIEDLSYKRAILEMQFWLKATKQYNLDKKKAYYYNWESKTIHLKE